MNSKTRSTLFFPLLILASCGGGGGGGGGNPVVKPKAAGVLVKDLDTREEARSSEPRSGLSFGNAFFFSAETPETGRELFRTDGSAAGTTLVRDIVPGSGSSNPQTLLDGRSRFFFAAEDATGTQIWTSDGTSDGTRRVSSVGSTTFDLRLRFVMNDSAYFTARDPIVGNELFVTDGTTVRLVRDINPGVDARGGPRSSQPLSFAEFAGSLYFDAKTETAGRELWVTDGTEAGTRMVIDLETGVGSSNPRHFTAFKGRLYFQARTAATGREIWSTDGTAAGTKLLVDFNPGAAGSFPQVFFPLGNVMLFNGRLDKGQELYKTDGTATGTTLVKDMVPGGINDSGFPQAFTRVGNVVVFLGRGSDTGQELWRTDGTTTGTSLIKDIEPGRDSGTPLDFHVIGDRVLFSATTSALGKELWVSDGSASGTQPVFDIHPGRDANGEAKSAYVDILGLLGNEAVMQANDGETGAELWFGTATTVRRVNITPEATRSSWPRGMTKLGETVFFSAGSQDSGRELFSTDGDADGTTIVRDIRVGAASAFPARLVALEDRLVFAATGDGIGKELFVSDGSAIGTRLLRDIEPGKSSGGLPRSSSPRDLTRLGNKIVFVAREEATGTELYVTDGTTAGTQLLADLDKGVVANTPRSSSPRDFVEFAGKLVFTARNTDVGTELFVTDGTASGTRLFRDHRAGAVSSDAKPIAAISGRLVFGARTASSGTRLFAVDSTGTVVAQLDDDTTGSLGRARVLGHLRGQLILASGSRLIATDGTPNGTQLLKESGVGATPAEGMVAGESLWFAAHDAESGTELWRTDGTPQGTVLAKDIMEGTLSSNPSSFFSPDGEVGFFIAGDVEHGRELWQVRADGTVAFLFDFRPGPADGAIGGDMITVGGNLLLVADDGQSGAELFRFPLDN